MLILDPPLEHMKLVLNDTHRYSQLTSNNDFNLPKMGEIKEKKL